MNGLGDRIDDLRRSLDGREREVMIGTAGTLVLAAIVSLGWWWMAARWSPPPSIFDLEM